MHATAAVDIRRTMLLNTDGAPSKAPRPIYDMAVAALGD